MENMDFEETKKIVQKKMTITSSLESIPLRNPIEAPLYYYSYLDFTDLFSLG